MQRQTTRRTRRAVGTGSLRLKHGSWYGSWYTVEGARTTRKLGTVDRRAAESILRALMRADETAKATQRGNRRILRDIEREPREPAESGVYFILAADLGRVKIGRIEGGVGRGVQSRLMSLQTGSPVPLTLHRFLPYGNSLYLETFLHQRYADRRLHGEWFESSVLEEVDRLTDRQVFALPTERSRVA